MKSILLYITEDIPTETVKAPIGSSNSPIKPPLVQAKNIPKKFTTIKALTKFHNYSEPIDLKFRPKNTDFKNL